MKKHTFHPIAGLHSGGSHAAALVVTLTFLVIVTILVLGFFSGVTLDRQAGGSTKNLVEQRLLTNSAVAHATSLLAENIPSPNYKPVDPAVNTSFTNWWVNPGRLTTQTDTQTAKHVDLYTTPVAAQSAGTVNLNARMFSDAGNPFHPIEPGGAALDVAWVEVLRDSLKPRQSNKAQPNYNPVVGRYAFWIDSETNKINFTTALGVSRQSPALASNNYNSQNGKFWPVGNDNAVDGGIGRLSKNYVPPPSTAGWNPWWVQEKAFSLGLPASVGYSGLVDANKLNNPQIFWNWAFQRWNGMDKGSSGTEPFDATKYHPRLTPRSIKAFVPAADANAFWNANRFLVTNRSWSPEFNAFGKPRFLHFFFDNSPSGDSQKLTHYQVPVREEMLPYIAARSGYSHSTITGFSGSAQEHMEWLVKYYQSYQRALGAYMQYPWPGIGKSFLDKWQQGGYSRADALAEIDQFAWNTEMAAVTTYDRVNNSYTLSSIGENPTPNQGGGAFDSLTGDFRYLDFWGGGASGGANIIGRALPPGIYSQRGMTPASPMPFVNELGLQVTPRRQSATAPNTLHLEFALKVEFFLPPGYSYGNWAVNMPSFRTNYLEYKITKNGGTPVAIIARLNQNNTTATADLIEEGITTKNLSTTRNTHYLLFSNPKPTGGNTNESEFRLGGGQRYGVVTTLQTPDYVVGTQTWNKDANGNAAVYFAHNPGATPGTLANLISFAPGDRIDITDIRLRMVVRPPQGSEARDPAGPIPATTAYYDVIPDAGRPGTTTKGLTPAATIDGALVRLPDVSIFDAQPGDSSAVKSAAIADPRLNGRAESWAQSTDPAGNTLGAANASYQSAADTSKLAWNTPTNLSDNYYPLSVDYPFASTGFLFTLSTGIQRGIPWKTIDLSEKMSGAAGMPPDYLLLDLFAMTHDYTRMHATEGKININTKVYPQSFGQNLDRGERILRSAVDNLQVSGTAINAAGFAQQIIASEPADGYAFSGQFMEAPALDMGETTEYGKQLLRARIANIFTNKTNTFTVHGVVETVIDQNGTLRPTSRRVFQSMIEREIFKGRDNVYGNGDVDASGAWTKIGSAKSRQVPGDPLDVIDGPDLVNLPMPGDSSRNETNSSTLLEDAYNPALPYYRYQVLNITYPNE